MQTSARAYSSTEGWHSCRVNFLSCMALTLSCFFWTVRVWCRQVYYQGNKSSARVMDPRPVNQKCLLMTWTENPKINPIIFQTLRWRINAALPRKTFRSNFKCEQTLTVFCMSVWVKRMCPAVDWTRVYFCLTKLLEWTPAPPEERSSKQSGWKCHICHFSL